MARVITKAVEEYAKPAATFKNPKINGIIEANAASFEVKPKLRIEKNMIPARASDLVTRTAEGINI